MLAVITSLTYLGLNALRVSSPSDFTAMLGHWLLLGVLSPTQNQTKKKQYFLTEDNLYVSLVPIANPGKCLSSCQR